MSEEWNGTKQCQVCRKEYSKFQNGWTYHSFDNEITCSDACKKTFRMHHLRFLDTRTYPMIPDKKIQNSADKT